MNVNSEEAGKENEEFQYNMGMASTVDVGRRCYGALPREERKPSQNREHLSRVLKDKTMLAVGSSNMAFVMLR